MRFHSIPTLILLIASGIALLIGGCTRPETARRERAAPLTRYEWIDSVMRTLTLEEKAGQMVMARALGYYYSSGSDENLRLERIVRERKPGGFVFFQGDVYETAAKINHLQSLSPLPLLIASDMEWGAAMRVRRTTRFPEAMALGATRDTMLALEVGRATGVEARALGIHQDYAPVADVNINPDNPVINTRSFGEDPDLVAEMAGAFAAGLDSGGVLATAKHFPGHGDTHTDSHVDLPIIDFGRGRLDSVELVPFKRLVNRGIASVMVGHLVVPALERDRRVPATLSRSIVGNELLGGMGFRGLVVTDAMEMGAVINTFGVDSAAVKAVDAGADILILLPDEERGIAAIASAVRSGRLSRERIEQSVRKILGVKWDLGLVQNRRTPLDSIPSRVGTPEHLQLAKRTARAAITVVRNENILPLQRSARQKIGLLIVADAENYRTEINRPGLVTPNEQVGDYFLSHFRKRYSSLEVVRIDPSKNAMDISAAYRRLSKCDLLVVPIYAKARSGSGKFGLDSMLTRFLDTVRTLEKPAVLLAMGSPYTLKSVPWAGAMVCGYSDAEALNEAAVEVLFGEVTAKGKLPVSIPGIAPYGTGLIAAQEVIRTDQPGSVGMSNELLQQLDSLLTRAVNDSAFPGGQVAVVKDGGVIYNKSFGRLTYDSTSPRVTNKTLYDLASLTKVTATTLAVMRLYDEGRIALDDSVVHYLPQFGARGKEGIRIRNLLVHNAGLPAFKRLFLTCSTPQEVLDSVLQTDTIYPIGDSTVYSDFDFIILAKIVETLTQVPFNRYVDSVFYRPLGMERTTFVPLGDLLEAAAPTEYDGAYRKSLVRGVVHDENAYALGGVAGHAGLFSTASDLVILMQMLMNGGTYAGKEYLKPETIALFTSRQSSQSTRALGWDTKSMHGYSSAGTLFGARTFGHTGFTGTSVWADPAKNLCVIFLTNRVHPTRANSKISRVRPVLHDTVVRAMEHPTVAVGM